MPIIVFRAFPWAPRVGLFQASLSLVRVLKSMIRASLS
jgi:hypothetical protein